MYHSCNSTYANSPLEIVHVCMYGNVMCYCSHFSFSFQPGCGVELSDVGMRFLMDVFHKYDKVELCGLECAGVRGGWGWEKHVCTHLAYSGHNSARNVLCTVYTYVDLCECCWLCPAAGQGRCSVSGGTRSGCTHTFMHTHA